MVGYLAANLQALGRRDGRLADALRRAPPAADLQICPTRSGAPTIGLSVGGRLRYIHSSVDPVAEATRLAGNLPAIRRGIFFGLGLGYHIEAVIASSPVERVVVIDGDLSTIRSSLAARDMTRLLADLRLVLLIDPSAERLVSEIAWVCGGALPVTTMIIPLRARIALREAFFVRMRRVAEAIIDERLMDWAIQRRFGRRWLHNTLLNLPLAAASPGIGILPRSTVAIVTAAGPSLDAGLPAIRRARPGALLIATDTSLPSLLAADLPPDVVVSIDCQQASYHHFFRSMPPGIIAVVALSSPPTIVRRVERPLFCADGHPLTIYLETSMTPFPRIDMEAGNVTHSALSLAIQSGADEVLLFGADYRYRGGAPYVRGSYLYDWLGGLASRLDPLDGALFDFMLRDPESHAIREAGAISYHTPLLTLYRQRLDLLLRSRGARVMIVEDPASQPISTSPAAGQPSPPVGVIGAGRQDWRGALRAYRQGLRRLVFPSLNEADRSIAATLTPLAVHLLPPNGSRLEAMRDACSLTLRQLDGMYGSRYTQRT